jgi:hypothetical protein
MQGMRERRVGSIVREIADVARSHRRRSSSCLLGDCPKRVGEDVISAIHRQDYARAC